MHGLEQKYGDKIDFAYLDIEDPRNDGFKQQFGFRVQPQILLLDAEGKIAQQWVGLVSQEDLEAALESAAP